MPSQKGRQHVCIDKELWQRGRRYKNKENEKYNIRFFFPMGLNT